MSVLKFYCDSCGQPDTYVVEELFPVEISRFLDFYDDSNGSYDVETSGEFIPDCKTVHVRYKCNECGSTIMEGEGLADMRLKEMNKCPGESTTRTKDTCPESR